MKAKFGVLCAPYQNLGKSLKESKSFYFRDHLSF